MDFSKVDKYGLAHDLIKVSLFNILVHVSMEVNYNDSKGLFGTHFLVQMLVTLLGFTLFYILVEPHLKAFFSSKKKQAKKAKKQAKKDKKSKSKKSKKSSSKSSSTSSSPVTTTVQLTATTPVSTTK